MQVFLPINIKDYHWYLAVVRPELEQVQVLDSLGLPLDSEPPNRIDLKTTVSNHAFLICSNNIMLSILN